MDRCGAAERTARRPKLGQHFLTDPRIVEASVHAAGLGLDDIVLEIGPGRGILTRALAAAAGRVVAIELDGDLALSLRDEVPANVEIVRGDAVTSPWPAFTACVSNLPYEASSPLLFRLLDEGTSLGMRRAVLMVQREFALRLVAAPDTADYGRLTVERALRAEAKILRRVPRGAFNPPPRVESALVELRPRPPPFPLDHEALFHGVVRAAFTQRRKMLGNALSEARHLLGVPGEALERALEEDAIPHAQKRPGEIEPRGFAEIADALGARADGGEAPPRRASASSDR
ncbi:MAG: 16S rRNA (adenine(1518)-N(6)/adenine(1519)-N(6))-dimethyltransferase RsmA [Thermoplasmatota archaeon]